MGETIRLSPSLFVLAQGDMLIEVFLRLVDFAHVRQTYGRHFWLKRIAGESFFERHVRFSSTEASLLFEFVHGMTGIFKWLHAVCDVVSEQFIAYHNVLLTTAICISYLVPVWKALAVTYPAHASVNDEHISDLVGISSLFSKLLGSASAILTKV